MGFWQITVDGSGSRKRTDHQILPGFFLRGSDVLPALCYKEMEPVQLLMSNNFDSHGHCVCKHTV